MDTLKLALTYTFKGKDKLVLGLNYFSLFCICLTISTLIVVFSITNGFITTIASRVFQGIYIKDDHQINAIVHPRIKPPASEATDQLRILQVVNELEYSVQIPKEITDLVVEKNIEYQVAMGRSIVDIGNGKIAENKLAYMVTPDEALKINELRLCPSGFWGGTWKLNNFQLANLQSSNPLTGLPRFKNFKSSSISFSDKGQNPPFGGPCIVRVHPKMYSQLFEGKTAYLHTYQFKDLWKTPEIVKALEQVNPELIVSSWIISPHFFDAMLLQKKIITIVYLMVITLVGALVLSVNISFYKDRRKDWALIDMLNIAPYAVEKILALRAFIMFLLCVGGGSALGVVISSNVNEILTFIGVSEKQASNILFGADSITAVFSAKDFILVNSVVLVAYIITYLVQLWAYKTNSPAVLLKQGA